LSEQISSLQRCAKHAGAEKTLIEQALTKLDEARRMAMNEGDTETERWGR
jgi:hypothetical protein